jgi:N-methylhydantoinase A
MGMSRLIVPLYPGLFSALGLLLADYRHDYIAAFAAPLASLSTDEILTRYEQLKDRARSEMISEGVDPGAIRFEQQVDLKYGYQMYEMTLPFPNEVDSSTLISVLAQLFTSAHNQAYGYYRDDPIELMSIRLRALAGAASLTFAELADRYSAESSPAAIPSPGSTQMAEAGKRERQAFFGPANGSLTTPLRSRFALAGPEQGPMIIEEPDTTVVVPPGWTAERDRFSNIRLTRT